MNITSKNLVIVTRDGEFTDAKEVLVGRKKRGRFAGYDIFPGGKAEGSAPQIEEAAREVGEEVGIMIPSERLHSLGRLVIHDMRPGRERFGNVFLYSADVAPDIEAVETPELEPRWQSAEDPHLTDHMPADVRLWWPAVRQLDEAPIITHITYAEDGALDVTVKRPDFAQQPGDIIRQATFPAQDRKD